MDQPFRCTLLFVALASFLFAAPTNAQDDSRLAAADTTIEGILLSMEGQFLELSEAYQLALANATAVKDAEAALSIARAITSGERSAFDPELFADGTRTRAEIPSSSPFSGASVLINNTSNAQAGVRATTPFGTELEVSAVGTRTETNSTFSALNPQYDAFGRISFRQPLLSGAGIAARSQLESARYLEAAAEAQLDNAVNSITATVEEIYWDIYAAERNYAVQRLILAQAEALLREASARSEAGLVGPSQVENARVFLAEQRLAVIDRDEELDRLSDLLSVVIGVHPDSGSVRFRPTDEPPTMKPILSTDEVVALAEQSNSSLIALQAQIDASTASLRGARRNRLPQVDLIGSLAGSGLSGQGRDVIFGSDTLRASNTGDFAEALSQVSRLDFPTWEVGFNVRIPLTGRARNSDFKRMEAEVSRFENQYEDVRRNLEQQVRLNHRALLRGAERLLIAQQGVRASEEQVRIGLIAYRNGQTTAFELVRLGADLAAAQQRYSQALVRNAKAAAALQRLTSGKFTSENSEK